MRLWRERNQGRERPLDSAKTQNTTTTHSATYPNINKYWANTPNKSDHSATKKHPNLTESGGMTRGVKKLRKGDQNSMEKLKKQHNFYGRERVRSDVHFSLTSQ
jgi:hypothetical protein